MKKKYSPPPRAERLNFDYTKAVTASSDNVVKNYNGWGNGCKNGQHPGGKTFRKKFCG